MKKRIKITSGSLPATASNATNIEELKALLNVEQIIFTTIETPNTPTT